MSGSEVGQQALQFITEVQAEAANSQNAASTQDAPSLDIDLLTDLTAKIFDPSDVTERLARRARGN
jgi:hypothetical protein